MFVTGHGKHGHVDLDWKSLVQPNQTVAVYMGLRNLESLTQEFVVRGARADMPAAIIDNATRPNQRVIAGTLQSLPDLARAAELRGPSILIIGTVVTLSGKLNSHPARQAPGEPLDRTLDPRFSRPRRSATLDWKDVLWRHATKC